MALPEFPLDSSSRRGRTLAALWAGPFVMGLLLTLLGVLALGAVVWTSLVSVLFFGVVLVVAGVLEIVHGLRVHATSGPYLLFVLGGLLSLLAGGLVLSGPGVGLVAITLLIAAYFLASGFFRGITSLSERYPGWAWDFAYGLVSVLLGVGVFMRMPSASLWVLGVVVGVEVLTRGLSVMAGSLAVRGLLRRERTG